MKKPVALAYQTAPDSATREHSENKARGAEIVVLCFRVLGSGWALL